MKKDKERLDVLLVEKGLVPTREKARRIIMAKEVMVDGIFQIKPGTFIRPTSKIDLKLKKNKDTYVSRGGIKLAKAISEFSIDIQDKVGIDVGASTGGFTDCLLQNGAKRVYAIDVGYGQLAWELRNNPNVIVMERVNVRYLKPDSIPELCDLATIDVSFISVTKFLDHLLTFLKDNAEIIILIKPQFEADRNQIKKGGIIRDKNIHIQIIENLINFIEGLGLQIQGLTYSPITGPAGNIEFLVYAIKRETEILNPYPFKNIIELVDNAHMELLK